MLQYVCGLCLCEKFTKQIVLIKNLFWEKRFNVTATVVASLTHSLRDNILSQWENELKSIHTFQSHLLTQEKSHDDKLPNELISISIRFALIVRLIYIYTV